MTAYYMPQMVCPWIATQKGRLFGLGDEAVQCNLFPDGWVLQQGFDTSNYVQAYYGDPNTDADDQWLGAPRDLGQYAGLKLQTDRGERWLAFADSATEPDVLLGLLLLSKTVSGNGDQRGMHDICAVFTTTRTEVEALWVERVAVVRPQ